METDKLRLLIETVNMKSINRAAEKLGHTQSGLTYNLNTLEDELGIKILERAHSGITLSEEGLKLMPLIKGIVEQEDMLKGTIRSLNQAKKESEHIRIGSYSSIADNILPDILKKFRTKYPNTYFEIRVGGPRILQWLDNDEIDLALIDGTIAAGYKWVFLCEDEIKCAYPSNVVFAKNKPALSQLIDKYPIIFPSLNMKSDVMERLRTAGYEESDMKLCVSSEHGLSLLSMVSSELGITFVSQLYGRDCPANVGMCSLEPKLNRSLGYIINAKCQNSKSIKRLCKMIENEMSV